MENNTFFGITLRSLGYHVRNCAGRVSRMWSPSSEVREHQGQTYDGWNHMLNLVKLDGKWWVVDVGMGAMGPGVVYPLEDGWEGVAVSPRRIRLVKRVIPEVAGEIGEGGEDDEELKMWCYDQCLNPKSATSGTEAKDEKEDKWIPTYCFTTTPFLPQDYEIMSWATSTHPNSFFTYSVLCTKLLINEDENEEEKGTRIVGDITLFNDGVRSTIGGKREVVRELKSEEERVRALEEVFGVRFSESERKAMEGCGLG